MNKKVAMQRRGGGFKSLAPRKKFEIAIDQMKEKEETKYLIT